MSPNCGIASLPVSFQPLMVLSLFVRLPLCFHPYFGYNVTNGQRRVRREKIIAQQHSDAMDSSAAWFLQAAESIVADTAAARFCRFIAAARTRS